MDSSVYASVYVTVTQASFASPTVTSVSVSPSSLSLDLNGIKTANLTATVIGNNTDLSKYVRPRKTRTIIREHKEKIGRNDPCPCGSGKKYKNCCLKEGNDWNSTRELTAQEMVKCKYGTSQPQDFKK